MKTVTEILNEVGKVGVVCTERTFWKYHQLRLLPRGRKKQGGGNVVYFPDETVFRLWLINFLTKKLEFDLSDVSRYSWSQVESGNDVCAPERISGEFILRAKNEYDKAKDTALQQLVDRLMKHLESSENNRGKRPNAWPGPRKRKDNSHSYIPPNFIEGDD
jgi:hypothetical protein